MRGFRYRFPVSLLSVLLSLLAPFAHAQQTVRLGNSIVPPSAQPPVRQVVLGNSTVPLDGLWKFHIGDSPQATGTQAMAWAQPGFDDSGWGTMNLTPPAGSYDPVLGSSGFVPGWTTHGYPGYSGYAWYRLHINIQDGQSALALKMPDDFDDAYQVYVNGQRIGEFGRFTAHGVTAFRVRPRGYSIPKSLLAGQATIAIRMWMSASTAFRPGAGGLHGPPVLGQSSVIHAMTGMYWYRLNRRETSVLLDAAVGLLALLIAFGLFWLDRSELAYLWLGLLYTQSVLYVVCVLMGQYTTWVSASALSLLRLAVLVPLGDGLAVIFWATWFRTAQMARLHRAVWSIVVLLQVTTAMTQAPLYGTVVPANAGAWLEPVTGILEALLALLLLWVTYQGIRKNRVEGLLALPAVLLVVIAWYGELVLAALRIPTYFYLFGVIFPFGMVTDYVFLAIVTVLLLRRFLHAQREREQWRLEIEQAKQVQQMLIPEALPVVPGLTLESEYRPAQSVGGDFFQIIPDKADGSVLIVVGDVTGHGLKAAMLVSLIVGAIREHTERGYEPLALLQSLNRRLLGRSNAQATCLALRIAADGSATLANAGHLPPYLNGNEMAMEGAMPLGMVAGAEFSVMHFQLAPGDRLMLLSDGVVEAQNEKRELFGFERARVLTTQPAAAVADAAQKFGQEDDITVVSITRTLRDAASAA